MILSSHYRSTNSFTLVELLVVIGILAILTAAVVIVLNPAELLKQSRDSKRTTDLANLNNAIKLLLTQNPDVSLGVASTVYISLSDSSSTCGSYVLPSLPAGWSYHCATTTDFQKTDGNGWIPVNFASSASQLPLLPTDPENTIQHHYSYIAGGSWQLAALFESGKYASKQVNDGGSDPASYEIGSSLSLAPFASGLVGYWSFEEGSGITLRDESGSGNAGTWSGTGVHYATGKVGSWAGQFASSTLDYVSIPNNDRLNVQLGDMTIVGWVYPRTSDFFLVSKDNCGGSGIWSISSAAFRVYGASDVSVNFGLLPLNNWHYVAVVKEGNVMGAYVDGAFKASVSAPSGTIASTQPIRIGIRGGSISSPAGCGPSWLTGYADNIRIYNRALSAAELKAIYEAEK